MRCNGLFRFDALVAFAGRAGADVLWTGHYARIVERDGLRLIARAAIRPRISRTCSPPSTRSCSTASRSRSGRRASAARGTRRRPPASPSPSAPRARRRASWRATTTARSSSGKGFPPARADRRRAGCRARPSRRGLALHAGQRRGIGLATPEPVYASRTDLGTNTLTVGPRSALDAREVTVRGHLYLPVARAEAKLRYRSDAVPSSVEATADGFVLRLDRAGHRGCAGSGRGALRRRRDRRSRRHRRRNRVGSPR